MKNKDPSQKKKPFTVFKMLGYIFGTTFLVTFLVIKGISFSSYKKTYEVYDTATVAKPILNLTFPNGYETGVVVNEDNHIQFTISNTENDKISETALEYKISIKKNTEVSDKSMSMYFWIIETDAEGNNRNMKKDGWDSVEYLSKKQLPAGSSEYHYYDLIYETYCENSDKPLFYISVDVEQVI